MRRFHNTCARLPIGGVVLKAALGRMGDAVPLVHLYIPFAVGAVVGMLPGSEVTKTLTDSGAGALRDPARLLVAAVIAVTCGILFPMLSKVPEVGVDIATQVLPPIVAAGYCMALFLRQRGGLSWASVLGCLILFLTYVSGLYASTCVTSHILCKGRQVSD